MPYENRPVPPRRGGNPNARGNPNVRAAAPRREPLQRGSRWFTAIIMVIITLIVCLMLAWFILQSASDLFGLNKPDRQIEIVVPQDPSLANVAALLYEKGVVTQPLTFRMYAGLKLNEEDDIIPGSYIMNSNYAYDEIIEDITTGDTKKEEVWVTFIEGETIYEMAVKLEENKVCDADAFLEYMQKANDIEYEYMNQVPRDSLRFRRLEGYAFPDTYQFYVGMDVALVADKFLYNLDIKLTEEVRSLARNRNLSIDELLTMASIIQKEATPFEMSMVSSVFHNRLDAGETYPRLESDVTRDYVNNFIKPFLDMTDQPMYDAYNTYVCEGLPVGPICNPGMDAIMAVLEPDESEFYFFVTDDEGVYYYARNLDQHNQNVYTARSVGGDDVHGTTTERE